MGKTYVATLTPDERADRDALLRNGKAAALVLTRARILLKADEADAGPGWDDAEIAAARDVGERTVRRVRPRFVDRGFEACLRRKPQDTPSRERKRDGKAEAGLVALAGSPAPDGRSHWTMPLRADKLVALTVVDAGCDETVRRVLKKNSVKPWLKEPWCIPAAPSGEFVARMADGIEVYHRPYDERQPVVGRDEHPVPRVDETRTPIPAAPGRPERVAVAYRRTGSANRVLAFAPLLGWRAVRVTDRRTAADVADVLRWVVDECFPEVERVVLVTGNLSVHSVGSRYEAFPPEEARRVAGRIEWHDTPEHGSWWNLAECAFAALSGECLDRRIGEADELRRPVDAWVDDRNTRGVEAKWRFTPADARVKLRRLYPSTQ